MTDTPTVAAPKPRPPAAKCAHYLHEDKYPNIAEQMPQFRCGKTADHKEPDHTCVVDGKVRTWRSHR